MKKEDLLRTIDGCTTDPDMSGNALEFYSLIFPEYIDSVSHLKEGFRGDCLISLGWTFGTANKTGNFDVRQRSYHRFFNNEEINLFYLFQKAYHCCANFVVMPRTLNTYRGGYRLGDNDNKGYGSCDYPDIFLNIVRSYYLGEKMSKRAGNYVFPYKSWLDTFGNGEAGWINFVNKNYLNPFVNENYEVKDLFSSLTAYKNPFCKELVGSHHDFDRCLPRCGQEQGATVSLPVAHSRAVNFIKNSLWIWEKRAELIENSFQA